MLIFCVVVYMIACIACMYDRFVCIHMILLTESIACGVPFVSLYLFFFLRVIAFYHSREILLYRNHLTLNCFVCHQFTMLFLIRKHHLLHLAHVHEEAHNFHEKNKNRSFNGECI